MDAMPIDPASLDTDTPRTLDGRDYPEHLRAYESLDSKLLPLLDDVGPATFDGFMTHIADPRTRAAAPRWLASAEWRGLVERQDEGMRGPRRLAVTDLGRSRLIPA
jgi:hypothetical protein